MHFFIFWGGFTEFPTPHEIQISSVMGGGGVWIFSGTTIAMIFNW